MKIFYLTQEEGSPINYQSGNVTMANTKVRCVWAKYLFIHPFLRKVHLVAQIWTSKAITESDDFVPFRPIQLEHCYRKGVANNGI